MGCGFRDAWYLCLDFRIFGPSLCDTTHFVNIALGRVFIVWFFAWVKQDSTLVYHEHWQKSWVVRMRNVTFFSNLYSHFFLPSLLFPFELIIFPRYFRWKMPSNLTIKSSTLGLKRLFPKALRERIGREIRGQREGRNLFSCLHTGFLPWNNTSSFVLSNWTNFEFDIHLILQGMLHI